MKNIMGRILVIDLAQKSASIAPLDKKLYKKYPGTLYGVNYLEKSADWQNILIYIPSMLAGIHAPGSDLCTIIGKSPLTKSIGETVINGPFASEIKNAGYDMIVIKGKSRQPVLITIKNEEVNFIDAAKLWGQTVTKSLESIKAQSDPSYKVALIGPAGENQVHFASIHSEFYFRDSGMGLGCVMGKQNCKGIAIKGTSKVGVANYQKVKEIYNDYSKHYETNFINKSTKETGMLEFLEDSADSKFIATRNFTHTGSVVCHDVIEELINDTSQNESITCGMCPGICTRKHPKFKDQINCMPDIELVAELGLNLGVSDTKGILKLVNTCYEMGLNTTSTSGVLAFAIEYYGEEIALAYGDYNGMIELIHKIVKKEGIGKILALGTKEASEVLGGESALYAMHIKGREMPMHNPRIKKMVALGYALNPMGPETFVVEHDNDFIEGAPNIFMDAIKALGFEESICLETLDEYKVRLFEGLYKVFSFMKVAGLCVHAYMPCRYVSFKKLVELMNAVTGEIYDLPMLLLWGEKRINYYTLWNRKQGILETDNTLPTRLFSPSGTCEDGQDYISLDDFKWAKEMYYSIAGWDKNGDPMNEKLKELGLDELK